MTKTHPWHDFLNARYHAIIWLHEEMGYSDERIARDLSMDTMQVWLIRTSDQMPLKPLGSYDVDSNSI